MFQTGFSLRGQDKSLVEMVPTDVPPRLFFRESVIESEHKLWCRAKESDIQEDSVKSESEKRQEMWEITTWSENFEKKPETTEGNGAKQMGLE